MRENNPMKNPKLVKQMVETNKKKGNYKKIGELNRIRLKGKKGRPQTKKEKEDASKRMKKNNPMKNPEVVHKVQNNPNLIEHYKVGGGFAVRWKKPGEREKQSIRMRGENNPMKDAEIAKRSHRGMFESQYKQTKPEIFIENILQANFPNEWKYVGNGQVFIGGKVPDYININGKKIVVEYASTYWHETVVESTMEDYVNGRTEHFEKYGYKTIFIFDKDLEESKIIEKVKQFYEVGKN